MRAHRSLVERHRVFVEYKSWSTVGFIPQNHDLSRSQELSSHLNDLVHLSTFFIMKGFSTLVVLFTAIVASNAAVVEFSRETGCNTVSQTYRGNCNFCADPPGDWSSVRFSDISGNHRVTIHNQDRCTSGSQVGQGYGPACWNQGRTKLRSAWVACPGQRRLSNGTIVNDTDVDEAELVKTDL